MAMRGVASRWGVSERRKKTPNPLSGLEGKTQRRGRDIQRSLDARFGKGMKDNWKWYDWTYLGKTLALIFLAAWFWRTCGGAIFCPPCEQDHWLLSDWI